MHIYSNILYIYIYLYTYTIYIYIHTDTHPHTYIYLAMHSNIYIKEYKNNVSKHDLIWSGLGELGNGVRDIAMSSAGH